MRKFVSSVWASVLLAAALPFVSTQVAAAEDQPPSLVETYDYPGADQIFALRGIRLLKGDGHILLVDCVSGTGQAEVWSRSKGHICFDVRGATGALTMEIPETYLLLGAGGHNIAATLVIDGVTSSVTVLKNEFRGIGESGPAAKPAVLLEFHATAA